MSVKFSVTQEYRPINGRLAERLLAEEIAKNRRKIVVLDDDPTGVQTVHDIHVYTGWDEESIRQGFLENNSLFYILTNSRAFTREETVKVHREIAAMVDRVAKETGKEYIFISRSDSTLRGHFPTETRVLAECYEENTGRAADGEILCFFFPEGGRYTIGNVHYVKYGDTLVPANETEFAKDKTFGYSAASLPAYVEEKTGGEYRAEDVVCISLEDLRGMNYGRIEEQLLSAEGFRKIVVNTVGYDDLRVFCTALYRAMEKGKVFLFRSAAALVKVMGGITSSDIGTKALGVRRACVLGQIRPGIPAWQTGEESKFPMTSFVIFPGNVGEAETLREAVEILAAP